MFYAKLRGSSLFSEVLFRVLNRKDFIFQSNYCFGIVQKLRDDLETVLSKVVIDSRFQ